MQKDSEYFRSWTGIGCLVSLLTLLVLVLTSCRHSLGRINDAARAERVAPDLQENEVLYSVFWREQSSPDRIMRGMCKKVISTEDASSSKSPLLHGVSRRNCRDYIASVSKDVFRELLEYVSKNLIFTPSEENLLAKVRDLKMQADSKHKQTVLLKSYFDKEHVPAAKALLGELVSRSTDEISGIESRAKKLNGGTTDLQSRYANAMAIVDAIVDLMAEDSVVDINPQVGILAENYNLIGDIVSRTFSEALEAEAQGSTSAPGGLTLQDFNEDFSKVMGSVGALEIQIESVTVPQKQNPQSKRMESIPLYFISGKNLKDYIPSQKLDSVPTVFHNTPRPSKGNWPRLGDKIISDGEHQRNPWQNMSEQELEFLQHSSLPICELTLDNSTDSEPHSNPERLPELKGKYVWKSDSDMIWPMMKFVRAGASTDPLVRRAFWLRCGFLERILVGESSRLLRSSLKTVDGVLIGDKRESDGVAPWAGRTLKWNAVRNNLEMIY
jgi:hypothetical protein